MLSIFTLEIPLLYGSYSRHCTFASLSGVYDGLLVRNALELLLPLNVIYTLATCIISALQLRPSSLINDYQLDLRP